MENSVKTDEIFIEKIFNASIESVFQAWTDPEKLMKWYAPDGCTIAFKKLEIEKGGTYHSCISNPQYGDCWCIGEYKEVIPNSKITFTVINADENGNPINPAEMGMDPDWPGNTVVTVTLTEENGKTKLQLRQTVSQELAKKTGAYPSWLQMLDNMQELLIQIG
ncbi:SRPBCC domain-containing protein [Flagellimonas halotolerans]|uniref:SRPBCC domain-containing protein n=1 Tax=Flagellimonas halotolerans TaxID=3112164 RepID=A0ABU6IRE4_9FLAO|nr:MULTISPECIES: SRPBCC domain-containing protein [unclassified Allomuricauda]MEC3965844.1 SRPBCC domain-containing protein [Muricauda sp. SYSU M86414]MEC4265690.1 SRPBCC domain-containing protein [Muricauda sp. SYSU M84420]